MTVSPGAIVQRHEDHLSRVSGVLSEVRNERGSQFRKWGEQNHPDGTGLELDDHRAELARMACDAAAEAGQVTYRHILTEEVCEAYAETDPAKLRAELIQVAAVAVAWVEAIDRRASVD